ncbi:hypothetical protein E8E14_010497 [Neopestalotiopsis sp. 37M]|nr:hypothetical protein E8E14_010497 [Neopestalotiopsis sp. 37M]
MTEDEKWRQTYRILFPDVAADQIPSPYFEPDVSFGLEEVRAYLRQEISALKDDPRAAEVINALSGCASPASRVFEALIGFVDKALTKWSQNSQNSSVLQNPSEFSASETPSITARDLQRPSTEQAVSSTFSPTYEDHKKRITYRRGTVVHNEKARGYNSSDPKPPYMACYSGTVRSGTWYSATKKVDIAAPDDPASNDEDVGNSNSVHSSQFSGALSKNIDWFDADARSEKRQNQDDSAQASPTRNPDNHEVRAKGNKGKEVQRYNDTSPTCEVPSFRFASASTESDTSESPCLSDSIDNIQFHLPTVEAVSNLSQNRDRLQAPKSPSLPSQDNKSSSLDRQEVFTNAPEFFSKDRMLQNDTMRDVLADIGTLGNSASLIMASSNVPMSSDVCPASSNGPGSKSSVTNSSISSEGESRSEASENVYAIQPQPTSAASKDVYAIQTQRTSVLRIPAPVPSNQAHFSLRSRMSDASDPSDWESESNSTPGMSFGSVSTSTSAPSIGPPEDLTLATELPCEFIGYARCDQVFQVDDVNAWAQHVMTDHLREQIPSVCCCWFCDDFIFDSEKSGVGRHTNFLWRMDHIRRHFVDDGVTISQIRPDFHFLDHLKSHGLIRESVFKTACTHREGPISDVDGIYAYNFEPPELTYLREKPNWIVVDQDKEDRQFRKKLNPREFSSPQNVNLKSWPMWFPRKANREGKRHQSRDGSVAADRRRRSPSNHDSTPQDTTLSKRVHFPADELSGIRSPDTKEDLEEPEEPQLSEQALNSTPKSQDSQENPDIILDKISASKNGRARDFLETENSNDVPEVHNNVGDALPEMPQSSTLSQCPSVSSARVSPELMQELWSEIQRRIEFFYAKVSNYVQVAQERMNAFGEKLTKILTEKKATRSQRHFPQKKARSLRKQSSMRVHTSRTTNHYIATPDIAMDLAGLTFIESNYEAEDFHTALTRDHLAQYEERLRQELTTHVISAVGEFLHEMHVIYDERHLESHCKKALHKAMTACSPFGNTTHDAGEISGFATDHPSAQLNQQAGVLASGSASSGGGFGPASDVVDFSLLERMILPIPEFVMSTIPIADPDAPSTDQPSADADTHQTTGAEEYASDSAYYSLEDQESRPWEWLGRE